MRPSQIAAQLECNIKAGISTMLHGSPGVGKSDTVRQLAARLDWDLRDIRISQMDSVDLRGVPSIRDGRTYWNVPSFLPEPGPKPGILFLDEINSAPQSTMAAAYQLVLDRRLGDYVVPDNWAIIAAGNRQTDRAIVNQMSTALKNRFVHLTYDPNIEDWSSWALQADIVPEVLAFLRFRPNLLNEFDAPVGNEDMKQKKRNMKDATAFATPRSWEFVSRLVKANQPKDSEFESFSGAVGEGAAVELMAFMKHHRSLPDLDALLMNPKTTEVPEEPA
ncbi:MAG TPA: MoxR family ATPase, partial [Nannocystis sp.]